jgi:hypothetical protein
VGVARAWLGFASRWIGPTQRSVHDVGDVLLPVVVVGHDACDGGGLRGVFATGSAGPGEQFQLALKSARGFTLWGLRIFTNAGSSVRLGLGPPPSVGGAPGTIDTFGMLREVVPEASTEPAAAGGFFLPITTGPSTTEAIDWHGRPIVVQPNEGLYVRSSPAAGAVQIAVLFEEGL